MILHSCSVDSTRPYLERASLTSAHWDTNTIRACRTQNAQAERVHARNWRKLRWLARPTQFAMLVVEQRRDGAIKGAEEGWSNQGDGKTVLDLRLMLMFIEKGMERIGQSRGRGANWQLIAINQSLKGIGLIVQWTGWVCKGPEVYLSQRAVMVVVHHAGAADAAVMRPRGFEELAWIAVGEPLERPL